MTLEQIRIFLEAAHFGSFTHAAERLGLTQSAVSVCIKKLEDKHDVILFDRSGRRLMLTEAGQVLLSEAERIVQDIELTVRRVESRRPADRQAVVACTFNAYDFWMTEIVHKANSEIPKMDLVRGKVEEVAAWVMRGTADIGVTNILPTHSQFRQVRVFSDRLILCGSPALVRNLPDHLTWDRLADHGPILWEQSDLTPTIMEGLSARRLDGDRLAHPTLKLSSAMAVISALKGGSFLGLLSERAASAWLASGQLKRVGQLEIPLPYWMFALRERDIDEFALQTARSASL